MQFFETMIFIKKKLQKIQEGENGVMKWMAWKLWLQWPSLTAQVVKVVMRFGYVLCSNKKMERKYCILIH